MERFVGLDEMRRRVGVDSCGARILLVFNAGEDARCSHDANSNFNATVLKSLGGALVVFL